MHERLTQQKIVRWGIIGCGKVTEIKSGPGFKLARNSQLIAVMRRTPGLAQDYAARHGVKKWYTDADALIADEEVDAVYIATPPGSHHHYAMKVCAAGKPAYIEKPMARNAVECDEMVHAFESARLPLFVAYYRRGMDRFRAVKQLLDGNGIGKLSSVRCVYSEPMESFTGQTDLPWRLQPEQSGGGYFLDLASHTLDLLDYFLGPLESISGNALNVGGTYRVEDVVAVSFRTKGTGNIPSVLGTGIWNFCSAVEEDSITFLGSEGSLEVPTFSTRPGVLITSAGRREFDWPYPQHVAQGLIQTIVDELLGEGLCPSTGKSGARTSRVIDTVLKSFYSGREDNFWARFC